MYNTCSFIKVWGEMSMKKINFILILAGLSHVVSSYTQAGHCGLEAKLGYEFSISSESDPNYHNAVFTVNCQRYDEAVQQHCPTLSNQSIRTYAASINWSSVSGTIENIVDRQGLVYDYAYGIEAPSTLVRIGDKEWKLTAGVGTYAYWYFKNRDFTKLNFEGPVLRGLNCRYIMVDETGAAVDQGAVILSPAT